MDINIQSIGFTADGKLEDLIKARIEKLTTYFDRIVSADVYMKLDNQAEQVKDKVVQIKLNIPGSTLVAKDMDKSFEVALDESIESLRRQLKKHKEKIMA